MADRTTSGGEAWTAHLRARTATGVACFALLYSAMLVNLLAGNDLPADTARAMAAAGSAAAVCACLTAGLVFLLSSLKWKLLCTGLQYLFSCLSLCVLDCQFAKAFIVPVEITYPLPAFYGCLVLVMLLPIAYKQDTIPIVLLGTVMNAVCLAFQLASYERPQPLLSSLVFESAVIATVLRFRPLSAIKYTSVADISKNITEEKNEFALGSELEDILNRLQKVHSNAEEAAATAKTAVERQRATESEVIMRDLLTRLKTKNLYGLSPEKLQQNLDEEEKVYLEENYLPQPMPKMTRRDRTRSSSSHTVIDPLGYSTSELEPMLCQVGKQWNFDTDFLTACSNGHPVVTLGDYMFKRYHLTKRLGLAPGAVTLFFEGVEEGYLPNSYHNSTHAADVMFSMFFLVKTSGLLHYSSDLEVAASVVAALAHDIGHPGVNNRYLVNSKHAIALECT